MNRILLLLAVSLVAHLSMAKVAAAGIHRAVIPGERSWNLPDRGGNGATTESRLRRKATGQRSHFGLRVPVVLNARARFTASRATHPGAAPGSPATLADGRVDRFYDDGYNRVNLAGNPVLSGEPRTSFFGYQSDVQVANLPAAPATGGAISMHSLELSGGDYHRKLANKPFPGLEAYYRHDWKEGRKWSVNWEVGLGYKMFRWEESGAPNSTVNLISDVYGLGGVVLPPAPYNGSFTPAPFDPLSGSTPVRTQAAVAAIVNGQRELTMHVLQLHVAPTLNWKPGRAWELGVQAGLAMGVGFSELSFAEQIAVADASVPVISQSGRSFDGHFWAGLFSAVRVNYRINESWSTHAELRHLWINQLRHEGPARSAEISLSNGFGVAAGFSRQF